MKNFYLVLAILCSNLSLLSPSSFETEVESDSNKEMTVNVENSSVQDSSLSASPPGSASRKRPRHQESNSVEKESGLDNSTLKRQKQEEASSQMSFETAVELELPNQEIVTQEVTAPSKPRREVHIPISSLRSYFDQHFEEAFVFFEAKEALQNV